MFKISRKTIQTLIFFVGLASSAPILGPLFVHPHNPVSATQTAQLLFGSMLMMWSAEFDSSRSRLLTNLGFWFGFPAIAGALLWSFTQYPRLEVISDPVTKGYAGVGIAAVTGLALFAMRYWYRMSYGLTEAGVGLYLAWVKWTTTTGPFGDLSKDTAFMTGLLTASIYLIVRGLDNVQTGWKARAKKIADAKAAAAAASVPVDARTPKA